PGPTLHGLSYPGPARRPSPPARARVLPAPHLFRPPFGSHSDRHRHQEPELPTPPAAAATARGTPGRRSRRRAPPHRCALRARRRGRLGARGEPPGARERGDLAGRLRSAGPAARRRRHRQRRLRQRGRGQHVDLLGAPRLAGMRVSLDSGASWSNDSAGLPNLDVRDIAVTTGGLAAGTDDGVALSSAGVTWYSGGLTGDSVSALAGVSGPSGPVFFAGVDYPNTGSAFLYRRSPNDGQWEPISSGLPSGDVVSSISMGPTTQTVTTNPVLVTTVKGTYRSGNGGTSWTASTGIPQNTYLTDSTFSPLDPNLVYAGADAGGSSGGGLFRSTDAG